MKILIVSTEVSPLAKVGGLADVAGALHKELSRLGHEVRIAMPSYPMIEEVAAHNVRPVLDRVAVPWGDGSAKRAFVKTLTLDKTPVYLIGSKEFFRGATESAKLYSPGWEQYAFFSRAVLESLRAIKPRWIPDVIHIHDWHPGMLPVYLRELYSRDPLLSGIAVVATVHNLAYQGEFDPSILAQAGLPAELYAMDKLECYGRVNFLKAGLVYSDMVNTVSETYACEIQTPEYGCRLDGLLRHLAFNDRLRGILNGLDYTCFDPAKDPHIKANYKRTDLAGKSQCKAALRKELGLPAKKDTPVIGMVTRLADQKGLDLVKRALSKLMTANVQLVILGAGDRSYERWLTTQAEKYPGRLSVTVGFDPALAQRIYAGCDMFLMPSRFEPCGLGQMIALRYGAVPIVRRTGGLGDTMTDFDPVKGAGNGFVFEPYDWKHLWKTIERALSTYADPAAWSKLVANGMRCDFSTRRMAKRYESLYHEALRKVSRSMAA